MSYIELGLIGLFLACFLAATILPLASEAILIGFLVAGYDPIYCLISASTGNTLGGVTNYLLGLLGNPEKVKKRFEKKRWYSKFDSWIKKYGVWLGLITWTPFIGDPLTIALGFYRIPFWPLLLLMAVGKFIRYYIIIFFFEF